MASDTGSPLRSDDDEVDYRRTRRSLSRDAEIDRWSRVGPYRTRDLCLARIFINELQQEDWPPYIRTLVDDLNGSLARDAAQLPPDDPLRVFAAALTSEERRYRVKVKVEWMDFHKQVLNIFSDHPHLVRRQDVRFEFPVGPISSPDYDLLTPEPDLTFGLATQRYPYSSPNIPPHLSPTLLGHLEALYGLQAHPDTEAWDVVFPCIIFEAEADCGTLLAAENQAAHGAAKALGIVQNLESLYHQRVNMPPSPRLPVIVICSQGFIYEVFVAFDLQQAEIPLQRLDGGFRKFNPIAGVHLVRVWVGVANSIEVMLQFQMLLHRILQWILETWRHTIVAMLDTIKAGLVVPI